MAIPDATTEVEEPSMRVFYTLRQDEPSTAQLADGPSSPVDMRGKCIAEEGYEMGFDLDTEGIRMVGEGFTRIEVRLEGSMRTIAIPMDQDLLMNTENVVPSLGPHYSNSEGKTLEKLDDAAL